MTEKAKENVVFWAAMTGVFAFGFVMTQVVVRLAIYIFNR